MVPIYANCTVAKDGKIDFFLCHTWSRTWTVDTGAIILRATLSLFMSVYLQENTNPTKLKAELAIFYAMWSGNSRSILQLSEPTWGTSVSDQSTMQVNLSSYNIYWDDTATFDNCVTTHQQCIRTMIFLFFNCANCMGQQWISHSYLFINSIHQRLSSVRHVASTSTPQAKVECNLYIHYL